ncbi:MAG: ATP-binding cassette domain-containing protein, partial [Planctomycetota bacterium]
MNSQPTLSVRDLSKRLFIHESDQHIQAFSGVSFDSFSGHVVCLVGASGSGKSSVLKCIYRTYLATSGEARYRTSGGDIVNLVNA